MEQPKRTTEQLIADLEASVHKLKISTFRLQLSVANSEKRFSDLIIDIKKGYGDLPKDFVTLAKERRPEYEHVLKMFIIFD